VPFLHGASVAYFDRPPAPSTLLNALQTVRPHLMLSVPIFIEKIVRSRVFPRMRKNRFLGIASSIPGVRYLLHRLAGKRLLKTFGGNLRFFGVGGAPLAPDVERFLRNARFPYSIGYGLTETAPLLAGTSPAKSKFRSTGPAVANVRLRIRDGEIQAQGPNVMTGYYRDKEKTQAVFTPDGWFRTGDLGEFDRQGFLYIKGRKKNVIIGSNGENIYPEAIEAVINQVRFVVDSLVLQKGSELIARVQINYEEFHAHVRSMRTSLNDNIRDAREAVTGFLEHIRKTANEQLGSYSRINRVVEQREPFEKTPTLKIKRYLYQL
jgi:long-chain acyl-CoA synthetase